METLPPVSSRSLQYYVIAKRWSSDLAFFRIETAFLQELLDRYSNRLPDQGYLKKMIKAGRELDELRKMEVGGLLAGQLSQLELMAEDIIPEDADALAAAQARLEQFMSDLTKRFRAVKKDIYQLMLDKAWRTTGE